MDEALWTRVDDYLADRLLPEDPVLNEVLAACGEAGLPEIAVSRTQGQMLHLFVLMTGARRILEIGTLGGYSTIFLARALPADGQLVTLEVDPHHAEVAQENFARAGVADKIALKLGPALESLPKLASEEAEPFDLVFIDADKPNNPAYLEWALRLSRPGTVIVCDNVVRNGQVADATDTSPAVQGTRRMLDRIASAPGLTATALQTVGCKGYDGFALLRVGPA